MTVKEVWELVQSGGVLGVFSVCIWAWFNRKIITRGELDEYKSEVKTVIADLKESHKIQISEMQGRLDKTDELNRLASEELRKQSSTNASLVEMAFKQRAEAGGHLRRSTD